MTINGVRYSCKPIFLITYCFYKVFSKIFMFFKTEVKQNHDFTVNRYKNEMSVSHHRRHNQDIIQAISMSLNVIGRDTLISDLNSLFMIAATQTVASLLCEFMSFSHLTHHWNLRLY